MLELTELARRRGDRQALGRQPAAAQHRRRAARRPAAACCSTSPPPSLDPAQRERLWAFIATLEATVLYTTHDVGEADRHADRVLVLADGELLYMGTPAELAGDRDLETAFLDLCAGS